MRCPFCEIRVKSIIEVRTIPQYNLKCSACIYRSQGTGTPSRKRSSEERQLVAVPQLVTVPEVQSSMAGLTESSSSGEEKFIRYLNTCREEISI